MELLGTLQGIEVAHSFMKKGGMHLGWSGRDALRAPLNDFVCLALHN